LGRARLSYTFFLLPLRHERVYLMNAAKFKIGESVVYRIMRVNLKHARPRNAARPTALTPRPVIRIPPKPPVLGRTPQANWSAVAPGCAPFP
jgi:hypothetical protein